MTGNHNRRLSGRGANWGFAFSSLICPAVLVGGAFLFVEAHARSPKNNPQALPPMPGGPLRTRALGSGTPEISMAREYDTGVSGGFRKRAKMWCYREQFC